MYSQRPWRVVQVPRETRKIYKVRKQSLLFTISPFTQRKVPSVTLGILCRHSARSFHPSDDDDPFRCRTSKRPPKLALRPHAGVSRWGHHHSLRKSSRILPFRLEKNAEDNISSYQS